jgi:hypothetical protein
MKLNARFMIDYSLHKKYHPMSRGILSSTTDGARKDDKFDSWPTRLSRGQDVDVEMLMVMPVTVDGFNFQTKTWGECQSNRRRFSNLIEHDRTPLCGEYFEGRMVQDRFHASGAAFSP